MVINGKQFCPIEESHKIGGGNHILAAVFCTIHFYSILRGV